MIDAEAVRLAAERFGLESGPHGPTVPPGRLLEFARAVKDELGCGYLSYITAAHYPEEKRGEETLPARFVVVYRVRNLARNTEFPFRCEVSIDVGVPSLAHVWAGADWQEREAYDLVGPRFEGHPDLRRIMLPEDWVGHPLQRQYAIDTPHAPWR